MPRDQAAAYWIIDEALASTQCGMCRAILEDVKASIGTERLDKSVKFAREIFCPTKKD